MTVLKLRTKQINKKGKLAWEYNPLYNLVKPSNDSGEVRTSLGSFDTKDIVFDVNNPVDIECQPSYDGSVNLIINDDLSVPRIINSGFSLLEDNSYERCARNQNKPTNIYKNANLETMLQRSTDKNLDALKVSLDKIYKGGELEGGNYVFMFKYADDDENTTRIIAESGVVSIFKNDQTHDFSVIGTLEHEKTDFAVQLKLSNIDKSFSKIQILYMRSYSDLTGTLQKEYCKLTNLIQIPNTKSDRDDITITITGIEPKLNITYDDIIQQYYSYKTVKTQTQVQNMLFFGNVSENYDEEATLQSLAYQIEMIPVLGDSISLDKMTTHRSSKNIYNNLGYMPGEYYRLGVVFVYNDESTTQVYNLLGCYYSSLGQSNLDPTINKNLISYNNVFVQEGNPRCYNTRGVFRIPEQEYPLETKNTKHVYPIVFNAKLNSNIISEFEKLGIRGYFFVRQARLPLFLGQGLSIGISEGAYCPMIGREFTLDAGTEHEVKKYKYGINTPVYGELNSANVIFGGETFKWIDPNESFKIKSPYDNDEKWEEDVKMSVKTKGLLCADSYLVPQIQSILDGSEFVLKPVATYTLSGIESIGNDGVYSVFTDPVVDNSLLIRSLITVPAETPTRSYNQHTFSSKCGSTSDVRSARNLMVKDDDSETPKPVNVLNKYLVRGNFGAYIGVCGDELAVDTIYNIYSPEYPGESLQNIVQYIKKLAYNNSEFHAITDRNYYSLDTKGNKIMDSDIIVSGGDCFYCKVSTKLQYNFLDNTAPLNTSIVSSNVTAKYSDGKKYLAGEKFDKIGANGWLETNVSDWNAVSFGTIINYPCMSNYNLNIRAINDQNTDERALFGNYRSFYPLDSDINTSSFKLPESRILPLGNSATLRCLPYYISEQVPFVKKHFDNRIAFSNVQANDSFANSYRVFTGLAYQDIERTYGAIVKLVPLSSSLFCVFEHGCGIVPINEKALLSTAQGQSIHLYGSQVIQSQVTVVSQDYGSTWENSIVVTPNGIYGVDTWAKKIWRYNSSGFSIISDQIVQRFLNDNITLSESDLYPIVAVKNVKTHYNNYKGDVMFTFYDDDKCWNLCFNERVDKFITRYSWTPLLSENIQNSFVSIDRTAVETYAIMAKNMESGQGRLYLESPKLNYSNSVYNTHRLVGITNPEAQEGEEKIDQGFYNHYDLNISGYADVYDVVSATIKSVSYAIWNPKTDKVEVCEVVNDSEHCFKHKVEELSATISSSNLNISGKEIKIPTKGEMFCLKWGEDIETTDLFIYEEDTVLHSAGNEISLFGEIEDDPTESIESDAEAKIEYANNALNDHGFSLHTAYNNFRAKARNYVSVEKGSKLRLDVKLNDFVCWLKINLEVTPMMESEISIGDFKSYSHTPLQSFKQTIVLMPDYDILTNNAEHAIESSIDYNFAKISYDKVNRVGFYTHGRAGIYDEINYTDSDPDNEIKPTFWYNKQEPFEFEFVVNTGVGIQKIFDNLAIIANNAEPEALEFSLIGDAYDFNKAGIFKASQVEPVENGFGIIDPEKTEQKKLEAEFNESTGDLNTRYSTEFPNFDSYKNYHTTVSQDPVLKQYYLHVPTPCKNVSEFGRLRGNIEYREDKWLLNIAPLYYQDAMIKNENGRYIKNVSKVKSTKLRDKWCKVRIKYKGDKLVVISAIQTMFTISYS